MDDRKYEIISFFDKCRWKNSENYGTRTYDDEVNRKIEDELKDEEQINAKLLTYICTYTMDRQTDYKKVWNKCGPIMADIIIDYSLYDKLEDNFQSFYNANKVRFEGEFGNRTFKDDMKSVYRTLYILKNKKDYKKHILKYLEDIKERDNDELQNLMDKLATKLYYLTYKSIKKDDSAFQEELENDVNNEVEKNISFDKFVNKRLWCVIRDFLKWRPREEFEYLFDFLQIDKEKQNELKKYLELPGDVWNNNSEFSKCLFSGEKDEKEKINKFLREKYKHQEKDTDYYPEQFDITFDFVRKMCNEDKCNICPFKVLKGELSKEKIEKICINKKDSYCTVALVCCGYKVECTKNCKLLEIIK